MSINSTSGFCVVEKAKQIKFYNTTRVHVFDLKSNMKIEDNDLKLIGFGIETNMLGIPTNNVDQKWYFYKRIK